MDVVLFDVHGRRCALPVSAVREVFSLGSVTPVPTAPAAVRGLAALHGQVLPLLDLGPLLPSTSGMVGSRGGDEAIAFEALLPGEPAPARAALAVERILHIGTVEPSSGRQAGTPAFITGLVSDASGPALLIDGAALLSEVQQAVLAAARGDGPPRGPA